MSAFPTEITLSPELHALARDFVRALNRLADALGRVGVETAPIVARAAEAPAPVAPPAPATPPRKRPDGTVWTPERNAYLDRAWLAGESSRVILDAVNAMPGLPVASIGAVGVQAAGRGLRRPAGFKGTRFADAVSAGNPAAFKRNPEREAMLRKLWLEGVERGDIVTRLNDLPGKPFTDPKEITWWAKQIGLHRAADFPKGKRPASRPQLVPVCRVCNKPGNGPWVEGVCQQCRVASWGKSPAPTPEPCAPIAAPSAPPIATAAPATPRPATPPPAPRLPTFSAARDAVIRRDYPAGRPLGDIAAECNRLPGPSMSAAIITMRAETLGLKRPAAPAVRQEPIVTDLETIIAWAAPRGIRVQSAADLPIVNAKAREHGLREFALPERRRA